MYSEIFEEFVKIAEEKESKKDSPKRPGSLTAEDIQKLYGLKPETHPGMEYDYNMVELAHPESVVIIPTHDKTHGLMGNQNEKHSLINKVVRRDPTGQAISKKLAEQELTLNLVRLANLLDGSNQELMTLADACLEQISNKPIKKEAQAGVLLGGRLLWGIGTLLAASFAQKHLSATDRGFTQNNQDLISEIDDLINGNTNFGVGKKYSPNFISFLNKIKEQLGVFKNIYDSNSEALFKMQVGDSGADILESAKTSKPELSQKVLDNLNKSIDGMSKFISNRLALLKDSNFINSAVVESGSITNFLDKNKFTDVVTDVFGTDDVEDVVKQMDNYLNSLNQMKVVLNGAKEAENKSTEQLSVYKNPYADADAGADSDSSLSDFFK